jgi:hypothetical protein
MRVYIYCELAYEFAFELVMIYFQVYFASLHADLHMTRWGCNFKLGLRAYMRGCILLGRGEFSIWVG